MHLKAVQAVDQCWNRIGVWGDRSCPELPGHSHCQNCPVFSAAGRGLLDRPSPADYLEEWAGQLKQEKETVDSDVISTALFRLGREWLALPSQVLNEVTDQRRIHSLPHRSNDVLLGLVNVRGELQLCISLAGFLGVEPAGSAPHSQGLAVHPRMLLVEKEKDRWAFPVDECQGIRRFVRSEVRNPPVTVAKTGETFVSGVTSWNGHSVGLLDEELLFYSIRKKVL